MFKNSSLFGKSLSLVKTAQKIRGYVTFNMNFLSYLILSILGNLKVLLVGA
jgi:hypothetical protein